MKSGKFEDFGIAPDREGILSFNMDVKRGRGFGLTWPSGIFFRYDYAKRDLKSFGKMCALGEDGVGKDYRTVCRSICVTPDDGSAYFTTSEGDIFRYRADTDTVEKIQGDNLRKDYFGIYDPTSPGHMGYNWRQTFYSKTDGMIYGVHGNSGYLFRFNPKTEQIQVLDRITSAPLQKLETDKEVADEEIKALLSTSLKNKKAKKKAAKAAAAGGQ